MPVKFYRTIRNWGNSKGVVIPTPILKELKLEAKDTIVIQLDGPRIIMEKR